MDHITSFLDVAGCFPAMSRKNMNTLTIRYMKPFVFFTAESFQLNGSRVHSKEIYSKRNIKVIRFASVKFDLNYGFLEI